MKILFLKSVARQGIAGEVKEVADGFASFLLKSGSVVVATPEVIKQNKKKIEEAEMRAKGQDAFVADLSKKIEGITVNIKGNSNPKGNLYKSIHTDEIAEALTKNLGIKVEAPMLEDITIKSKGEHVVNFIYKNKKLSSFTLLVD